MATFLNDTFTDTDGVALGSHTGETGATWTKHPSATYTSGAALIATNRAYPSGTPTLFYASGSPSNADYEVATTLRIVSAANVEAGIAGRISTSVENLYLMRIVRVSTAGGTWSLRIQSGVAGAYTQIASVGITAPTVGTDHTLRLRMVADQISGYYDGVLVMGPVTDTGVTAAGKAGVQCVTAVTSSTGFHLADITATDIKAGKILCVNKQAVNRAAYF